MIITSRLMLSPAGQGDTGLFLELFRCADTTRYLPGGKPYSEDYIRHYVSQKQEHWVRGFGTFVISDADNPDVKMGYAGIEEAGNSGLYDVRYALLRQFHGKGYAYEATKAVLDFTFSLGICDEVFGVAVKDNQPSLALLSRLGMRERSDVQLYPDDQLITMSVTKGGC